MILNSKKRNNDYVVSVCDDGLLGKTLEDSDYEIKVSKNFYGEKKASADEVTVELSKATIINAIGEESISILSKVKGDLKIIKVSGVPHAQWIKII